MEGEIDRKHTICFLNLNLLVFFFFFKAVSREWEDKSQADRKYLPTTLSDKELLPKIYKELLNEQLTKKWTKDPNRQLTNEDIWWQVSILKNGQYDMSLGMQIKAMTHHHIPIKRAKLRCTILQWWTQAIINLSQPIEYSTLRINLHVNYGLWMIIRHQCGIIYSNNWATPTQGVSNWGGCVYVATEVW